MGSRVWFYCFYLGVVNENFLNVYIVLYYHDDNIIL